VLVPWPCVGAPESVPHVVPLAEPVSAPEAEERDVVSLDVVEDCAVSRLSFSCFFFLPVVVSSDEDSALVVSVMPLCEALPVPVAVPVPPMPPLPPVTDPVRSPVVDERSSGDAVVLEPVVLVASFCVCVDGLVAVLPLPALPPPCAYAGPANSAAAAMIPMSFFIRFRSLVGA
jgi:hypothetical protein